MNKITLTSLAAIALAVCAGTAIAQDRGYTEGPVVNLASIRTVDGKFDDYMAWISTTWKKQEEAAKKAGHIISYQVFTVEPRGPNDPDVILMITYKNWAALDGSLEKGDAIAREIEGSVANANKSQVDRAKIRTVLGSQTIQALSLK